jgi:hypothetical protein
MWCVKIWKIINETLVNTSFRYGTLTVSFVIQNKYSVPCMYWEDVNIRPGTHYPHVTWAHVMLCVQLGCERRFNIEFYGADSHFCHSAYVRWSHMELWSSHTPARLTHFCYHTHFVRRDIRVECSSDIVTSCFQKWRKCLLKKCANGPFYMTPSHQIIEISIWEPTRGKR